MKEFQRTKINHYVKTAAMDIVIENADALKVIQKHYENINTMVEFEVFKKYVLDKVNNFYGDVI